MQTCLEQQNSASAEVQEQADGKVTVMLRGLLDSQNTAACWRKLETQLKGRRIASLDIDASQLTVNGSIGIALLSYLAAGGMTPGVKADLHGLKKEIQD